jgi:hypothetical protein
LCSLRLTISSIYLTCMLIPPSLIIFFYITIPSFFAQTIWLISGPLNLKQEARAADNYYGYNCCVYKF